MSEPGRPANEQQPQASPQAKPRSDADVCPRCGEAADLALIKGCLRCLKCGFKWDCNGW
jgi:ribosomal protein S27AE